MCGRYAATANPDELVIEFEVDEDRTGEPGRSVLVNPQEPPPGRPDHNMAPTKRAPVVLCAGAPRRPRRRAAPPAAAAHVGPGPQLVQGPRRRRPDDQRAGGVGRRQARLRPRPGLPALPGAGARVVRVAGVTDGARRRRASRASSRSSPPGSTAAASRWPASTSSGATPPSADADDPLAWLTTFTVVTGPAEPGLDRIHDRQPLVLEPEEWATWLDPGDRGGRRARACSSRARPGASRPTPCRGR